MEDYLYAVIYRVEHVAASDSAEHRIIPVVHNIMRRHWRQSITLQTIQTAFDLNHVVFRQQLTRVRKVTPVERIKIRLSVA